MKPVYRAALAASLLVMAMSMVPAARAFNSGDVLVESARGDARLTQGGREREARRGMIVVVPATLRTGRDGMIDLRQGQTVVNVGPDTVLEFPASQQRGEPVERIVQSKGSAFYDVGKRDSRKLRVETPYLVAVIKGTQFSVSVQDGATSISLVEGQLEILSPDGTASVDIEAGEIATRRSGDAGITVIDVRAPAAEPTGTRVDASVRDDRAGVVVATTTAVADARARDGRTDVSTTATVGVQDAAGAGASVGLTGARADFDGSALVAVGNLIEADADTAVSADAGSITAETTTRVDTGLSDIAVDTGVSVDAGSGTVSVDASLGVALDPVGDVAASVGTTVDPTGGITADVGVSLDPVGDVTATVDVGTDIGQGGIGADVGTDVVVDTGPLDAGLDVGLSTDLGAGTSSPAVVEVDAGATVGGVDADVTAGVDLGSGTIDLGVDLGSGGIDLGLDLGLDDGVAEAGTPDTTESGDVDLVEDVGGLLGGLLRPR
jgi:hypothetical protein